MQRPAKREFIGAAAEGLFGGKAGEVRIVILLGEVREDEMARMAVKNLRVAQKLADHGIRKVPGAAHHALLDKPWIGPDLEHIEVVVRFEDQKIGFAQMMLHQLRHIAQIGDDSYLRAVATKGVAHRIGCVMRDGEGIDFDVANLKALARVNVLDALHLLHRPFGIHFQDFRMGGLRKIGGAIEQARQLRDPAGMVGVLVGDQDRVDTLGLLPAQRFQAAQQFLLAKSRVNEEGGVLRFEQRAVARAAGSQNGDPERDACSLRVMPARSLLARQHREGSWQIGRSASIKTSAKPETPHIFPLASARHHSGFHRLKR